MAVQGSGMGAVASYQCDRGYRLEGDSRRVCQASETWTGTVPTCRSESLLLKGTDTPRCDVTMETTSLKQQCLHCCIHHSCWLDNHALKCRTMCVCVCVLDSISVLSFEHVTLSSSK